MASKRLKKKRLKRAREKAAQSGLFIKSKQIPETKRKKKRKAEKPIPYSQYQSESQQPVNKIKVPEGYQPRNESGFTAKQRKQDTENKRKLATDEQYQAQFKRGDIAYNFVLDLINENIKVGKGWGGKYLLKFLNSEIDTYGYDKVMLAIGNAPSDFIEKAQVVVEGSDKTYIKSNLMALWTLISGGEVMSAKENAALQGFIDQDEVAASY